MAKRLNYWQRIEANKLAYEERLKQRNYQDRLMNGTIPADTPPPPQMRSSPEALFRQAQRDKYKADIERLNTSTSLRQPGTVVAGSDYMSGSVRANAMPESQDAFAAERLRREEELAAKRQEAEAVRLANERAAQELEHRRRHQQAQLELQAEQRRQVELRRLQDVEDAIAQQSGLTPDESRQVLAYCNANDLPINGMGVSIARSLLRL